MANADLDQEFTHARHEHARRIQAENDCLQDQVRAKDKALERYQKQLAAYQRRLEICKEKYGPKCDIRYSPPEVSSHSCLSRDYPLFDFISTFSMHPTSTLILTSRCIIGLDGKAPPVRRSPRSLQVSLQAA